MPGKKILLILCISFNIGTFSDGPFNPNEDPIGALITFVGCGPGKEILAHLFIICYLLKAYSIRLLLL